MNLIITMAGIGSRFKQAGYNQPKYKIKVCGASLFEWSIKSLENFRSDTNTFIFIVRRKDSAKNFIVEQSKKNGISKFEIIEIEKLTDGQATTAILASDCISDPTQSMAIYNIDTYVDPAFLKPEMIKGDGWIPCFAGLGNHWSFARLDRNGKVAEVREKQRVSPHTSIGLYWFNSFELYRSMYMKYYNNDRNLEKGEKFIAPIYNQIVQDGLDVYIKEIPSYAVHGLGTPEEIIEFRQHYFHV